MEELTGGFYFLIHEEDKRIIETEIEPKIDKIKNELENILDPETIEDIERLHREVNILSFEDLFRPFTI